MSIIYLRNLHRGTEFRRVVNKFLLSRRYFSGATHDDQSQDEKSSKYMNRFVTIPNVITMSRIAMSPMLGLAIYYDMKGVALLGCAYAGASDWLDGYIARKYHMKSLVGAFLDPIADKLTIGSLTFGLAMKGLLPLPLAWLILVRDVALLSGGAYFRYKERPMMKDFFDPRVSSIRIVPSQLSKVRPHRDLIYTVNKDDISHNLVYR